MRFGTYEIGLTEGAKIDDETGNKFLEDAMFKTPKLLKDMMSKLFEIAPHKKNSQRTVGLVTSRLDITMLVMDFPEKYIFRVLHTKSYNYPMVYPLFVKEIRPCLELTWLGRMILEETVEDIISPTPPQIIGFNTEPKKINLATFYKELEKD